MYRKLLPLLVPVIPQILPSSDNSNNRISKCCFGSHSPATLDAYIIDTSSPQVQAVIMYQQLSSLSSSSSSPSTRLFPVRIDVSSCNDSDNKTARIIDTILIDPTCWPIPLYEPLEESVERNIKEYAHTILSDAEVHGMGRTVRHFTGRLELWTTEWQNQIEDQIRSQIWSIVNHHNGNINNNNNNNNKRKKKSRSSKLIPISIRLLLSTVITTTSNNSTTNSNNSSTNNNNAATSTAGTTATTTPTPTTTSSTSSGSGAAAATTTTTSGGGGTSSTNTAATPGAPSTTATVAATTTTTNTGILIHEDILWDPSIPISPLEFAQDLATELHLPDEAAIEIATTMIEQILLYENQDGDDDTDDDDNDENVDLKRRRLELDPDFISPTTGHRSSISSSHPSTTNTTSMTLSEEGGEGISTTTTTTEMGAWKMDPKEFVATAMQIVSNHRPS